MENRLYRSQTDKMLGGVCTGLAKYFLIDVVIVRLLFVAFTLLGGVGPLIYIILWIVLPVEGQTPVAGEPQKLDGEELKERAGMVKDEFVDAVRQPNRNTTLFIGAGLILLGGYLFMKQFHIPWLSWLNANVILAGLVLVVGIILLIRATRKDQ